MDALLADSQIVASISRDIVPVIAIVGAFLVFIVKIVASATENIYRARCNAMLKQDLINRGATAYEIAQIVNADGKVDKKWAPAPTAAPMQKVVC